MRTLFATPLVLVFAALGLSADVEKPAAPTAAEIQRLVQQLGDESFDVREKASEAIVKLGISALPHLEKAEKAEDAEVRIRASRAIEAIKSSPTFLVDALKSGTAAARRAAADKLGQQGPAARAALPALEKLLNDADESVRDAAISAIINIDSKNKAVGKFVPEKAHVSGKYKTLLRRIKVPQDQQNYKDFHDYGHFEGNSWAGYNDLPPGYWVYIYPHWFIWGELAK
jgi:hypothetical protein